jgi:hypothetical protein
MTGNGTGQPRRPWSHKVARATAVAGVATAAIVLLLWAVPAIHPAPARREVWTVWDDTATQDVARYGLARHGFVWQQRSRVWEVPPGVPLPDRRAVRAAEAGRPLSAAASDDGSLLQSSSYGVNHVFAADGREFRESGAIVSAPPCRRSRGAASRCGGGGGADVRRSGGCPRIHHR